MTTWQTITELYNRQSLSQLTPENIEEWLSNCAQAVRVFLYPKSISVDAPLLLMDKNQIIYWISYQQI